MVRFQESLVRTFREKVAQFRERIIVDNSWKCRANYGKEKHIFSNVKKCLRKKQGDTC